MNLEARNRRILELNRKGLTRVEIGRRVRLSRERVRQIIDPKPKKKKLLASQLFRRTCFICRKPLAKPRKFCEECIELYKLNRGGREVTRGIVRGRDANTCQVCGRVWKPIDKKRFDVHHLDGLCGKKTRAYDDATMMHKLITVCHRCHYNLHDHRKYGDLKHS